MPRLLARLLAGSLLLLSWITTADAASRHAVISGTDVDLLPGEALISLKKQAELKGLSVQYNTMGDSRGGQRLHLLAFEWSEGGSPCLHVTRKVSKDFAVGVIPASCDQDPLISQEVGSNQPTTIVSSQALQWALYNPKASDRVTLAAVTGRLPPVSAPIAGAKLRHTTIIFTAVVLAVCVIALLAWRLCGRKAATGSSQQPPRSALVDLDGVSYPPCRAVQTKAGGGAGKEVMV